jgi:hypothetical protein
MLMGVQRHRVACSRSLQPVECQEHVQQAEAAQAELFSKGLVSFCNLKRKETKRNLWASPQNTGKDKKKPLMTNTGPGEHQASQERAVMHGEDAVGQPSRAVPEQACSGCRQAHALCDRCLAPFPTSFSPFFFIISSFLLCKGSQYYL